ncbi:MAG: rod shape-determining protein [Candidatus Magasanikbacteria bacterium CG10_big_fil_rev_8_21_14_0_10_40_10]|uniref:Cell shape-determining protein MreB n=1 Tax=Candidatus Magasanikbacteria bacterium CG10_big_fil_rev_8_21_14_0_10_40_10 TaxID=1974648 RepID=A0A2M6W4Y6_9BACT|nr:MAG: rod shape-determining protein [Candidatus Magasanikbacteria bacterium CG10_big_fil_rev_8_21_14_0_10_40_10]
MFKNLFDKFRKDLAIDLGTANTLVYVQGRGVVINEPSVVAVNTRTEQILSVGSEAKDMLGKTPPHIITTRPLVAGIISDFEVTEKMMHYFFEKVRETGRSGFFTRPRVVIGAPLDITEVEKKAINDAALNAGAKEVWIVEEAMASAIGSRMPVREPVGNFIVEMGGGTCEIAVISLGGIVTFKSIQIAGDELNRNIISYARDNFNLLLGEKQAEEIKIKIGSAVEMKDQMQFPMRGRDLISGLPREIMINDTHVRQAISRSLKTIIDNIKETLEVTPPELVADIHERGILISGGGALLRGLDRLIARATEIPVRVADDPLTSVVRGAGILLDEPNLLKEIVVKPQEKN